MALGRPLSLFTLVPAERQRLLEWSRRPKTEQALAMRARIVLLCAEGRGNTEVARRVHVVKGRSASLRKYGIALDEGQTDNQLRATLSQFYAQRNLSKTKIRAIAPRPFSTWRAPGRGARQDTSSR